MSILGDLYRNEAGGSANAAVTGYEPTDIVDPSNNLTANSDLLSQQTKKRPRPPRICNICGLQVTGQRSSLIYHANSKYELTLLASFLKLPERISIFQNKSFRNKIIG